MRVSRTNNLVIACVMSVGVLFIGIQQSSAQTADANGFVVPALSAAGYTDHGYGGFISRNVNVVPEDVSPSAFTSTIFVSPANSPSTLMTMQNDFHTTGDPLGLSTMTMSYGLHPMSTTAAPIPFFDIDTPSTLDAAGENFTKQGYQAFHIDGRAGTDSLAITPTGVGIGLGGWANGSGARIPAAALHVYSDDGITGMTGPNSSPFTGDTSFIAENAKSMVLPRTMFRLANNGPVFFTLRQTTLGKASEWQFFTDDGKFSLRRHDRNDHALHPQLTFRKNGSVVLANTQGSLNISTDGVVSTSKPMGGSSDRNKKENIKAINPQDVLSKVAELPISTWNYIDDKKDVPHIGPMAQDFSKFFGFGDDDKSIAFIDNCGVALAAIQGLHQNDVAKDEAIAALGKQLKTQAEVISTQDDQIVELTERLEALEAAITAMQN